MCIGVCIGVCICVGVGSGVCIRERECVSFEASPPTQTSSEEKPFEC